MIFQREALAFGFPVKLGLEMGQKFLYRVAVQAEAAFPLRRTKKGVSLVVPES